jgi:hypothetical protein
MSHNVGVHLTHIVDVPTAVKRYQEFEEKAEL